MKVDLDVIEAQVRGDYYLWAPGVDETLALITELRRARDVVEAARLATNEPPLTHEMIQASLARYDQGTGGGG